MNLKELNIETIDKLKQLSPKLNKDSLKVSIPFFILHKNLFNEGEKVLKDKFFLSQSELDVLTSVLFLNNKLVTPTDLYDVMLFTSGGMTKVLKKLERKNYIVRTENLNDKRSKFVEITDLGKEITINALEEIITFEDRYFSKLNSKEQIQLQSLFYKMLNK